MCTYETATLPVQGAGKGAQGWFPLSQASVYFDHPARVPAEHALNIDLLNVERGAAARVAVELDADSARRLAEAIMAILGSAPASLVALGTGRD